MDTVTHREMRNQSAEILRRVGAGESLLVTNSGRAAAILSPVSGDAVEALIATGGARRSTRSVETLRSIDRSSSSVTTASLIEDSRGHW